MAEQNNNQKPIVNPTLVQAIENMKAKNDSASQQIFAVEMKNARFIAPINVKSVQQAKANEDGTVELTEQPQLNFIMFNNQDQKMYLPIFTDDEEFSKWNDHKNHKKAALSYNDLCHIIRQNNNPDVVGAVINAFSHNILIPSETLFKIQELRPTPKPIAPGTKIQIGTLKEEPTPLLDGVRPYLESQSVINKVYLRVMKREDMEHPNFLFVVDIPNTLSEAELKTLFDGLAEAARPNLRNVELAIVPMNSKFGAEAIKGATPFYEK